MKRWIVVVVMACASSVAAEPVTGRVVLDGSPVRYFGVVAPGFLARPVVVRARDGRFHIDLPAGANDLVVVGPSFARQTIAIHAGDVGDIAVTTGHVVTGTVRDEDGAPVAGATVRIGEIDEPGDELARLALGTLTATTDASGRYRIAGLALPPETPRAWLHVSTEDRRASEPFAIPDFDVSVDPIVHPTGAIEVTRTPGTEGDVFVLSGNAGYGDRVIDGVEHYDFLPAGDYDVLFMTDGLVRVTRHVTVAAGAIVPVTFDLPPVVPVAIELTFAGACTPIALHGRGAHVSTTCSGASIRIPSITPGVYSACGRNRCEDIDVEETPAVQQFTLDSP